MKIAVDAMGGDHAPDAPVKGALAAIQEQPSLDVILVGEPAAIHRVFNPLPERVTVFPASQVITMEDRPVAAVKTKRDSSMVHMIKLVAGGEAVAGISAGNTGALMTAGLLSLGRMPGIERPALSAILPVLQGWGVMLLDVGANLDPKPSQLVQYALMGSVYCEEVFGMARPRVALLNVGEEAGKGPPLIREAYQWLKSTSLNFIGNLEARELLQGKADVVICDGFSGNIALKLTEGVARDIMSQLRRVMLRNWTTKLATLFLKSGLNELRTLLDYQEYGGAPLLGLDQPIYKCHGASETKAFRIAITMAHQFAVSGSQQRIKERVVGEETNG
ncbi:MAG: phosphate acyltransferase PlsX [Firmicutes bacterium]|nr:phosphate acyltransferase PlsX [Bacillota bacterium]